MYVNGEEIFYYLTLYNETYHMPAMAPGAEEGIVNGLYRWKGVDVEEGKAKSRPQIFGSGAILLVAEAAQKILAEKYGVASDLWSATSYCRLRRDADAVQRWNLLHPEGEPRVSYLERVLDRVTGPFIAVSDYVRMVPEQIRPWVPGDFVTLGTD